MSLEILMHPAVNTSTAIGCEKDDGTEAFYILFNKGKAKATLRLLFINNCNSRSFYSSCEYHASLAFDFA